MVVVLVYAGHSQPGHFIVITHLKGQDTELVRLSLSPVHSTCLYTVRLI